MSSKNIAFFDAKPYDQNAFDKANQNFNYDIHYFEYHLNPETAVLAKNADAVCAFVNDDICQPTIEVLADHGINLIALRSAGYNNVDLEAAYQTIHVVRVPAYSPYAVAEHTMALILALNRNIHRAYYRIRDNNFSINGLLGFDLHGKTAGIIGTGKIGKVLIKILQGFEIRVLAYDIYPDEDYAQKMNYEYVDLDTLYAESDIISLNAPLTQDTYHMINADSIAKMKTGVMLINTGRGHLIDSVALIEGLKEKKIGSAGLDVYEEESKYFFEDFSNQIIGDDVLARLMTFSNVLITSHQGFFTKEALHNIAETTLQNITEYFNDEPLTNEICYQCPGDDCRKEEKGRCF